MDRVLSLIEHYGYLAIPFGVMLEGTGVPLPGETILLASGVLIQRGHLDLGDVIAFGILGAVLGDQIGSWVGRGGGVPSSSDGVATSSSPPGGWDAPKRSSRGMEARPYSWLASSPACACSALWSPTQAGCAGENSPSTTSLAEPCGPRWWSRSATFCGQA
jgi:hypothetical protein